MTITFIAQTQIVRTRQDLRAAEEQWKRQQEQRNPAEAAWEFDTHHAAKSMMDGRIA